MKITNITISYDDGSQIVFPEVVVEETPVVIPEEALAEIPAVEDVTVESVV